MLTLLSCGAEPVVGRVAGARFATRAVTLETEAALADAVARYEATRQERLLVAVDPNERFETLLGPDDVNYLAEIGDFDLLFQFGDEGFEAERDRVVGIGQGPVPSDPTRPAPVRRIHIGERGGNDASSCKSCHFSGGPDGAGTLTQVALLRGDGETLSSSVVRDAPHVMGLGYLEIMARWYEQNLDVALSGLTNRAIAEEQAIYEVLRLFDRDIGPVIARPDGTFDFSGLNRISPDLKIRPFGWKGRHSSLVELVDEALQVHHGHQTVSREAQFPDDTARLGDGPVGDRDGDGVVDEASAGLSPLLASYLAMLPIPVIRPPAAADLQQQWVRGSAVFDEVGCATCHQRSLRLERDELTLRGLGPEPVTVQLLLPEHGQEPKPARVDFGTLLTGTPIYPFTDLLRHDLGGPLAEPRAEVLPSGHEVPGGLWLTRPLWGLADTAPYLHDGRAPTVDDAIFLHAGEAEATRTAWLALRDDERSALRVFLLSLTRAPTLLVE